MKTFQVNDGGRAAAGFRGTAGDCVTRAVAIASGRPYREVYDALAEGNLTQRSSKHSRTKSGKRTAANGIYTTRKWFKDYMVGLGFRWVPTMGIGTGCTVHLRADELPAGRLVVAVSKHYTAMIDGVIHDTHNPQRPSVPIFAGNPVNGRNPIIGRTGERCVYGYWILG